MRATTLALTMLALLLAGCGGDEQAATNVDAGSAAPGLVHGGLLYDKHWKVSQAAEPKETHPFWAQRPDTQSNRRSGSTTWRCKECHGWDYKGVEGVYGEGSHRTGFPGVFGSTKSEAELRTSIAETHGYRAAGLSEADVESLVRFVREGLVDTSTWIDEQGAFRGDAEAGRRLYVNGVGENKSCASCHGPKGLKPPSGPDSEYGDFVGLIANKNPWELLHKVRFGQPGTQMPAAASQGLTMQDIVDLCAYCQTLPKAP